MTRPKPSCVSHPLRSCLAAGMAAALLLSSAATGHGALRNDREHMREISETGQPGLLSLTSSVLPLEIPWLKPGDSFSWQIGLHLAEQPLADGSVEFIPFGGLVQPATNYLLTARRCEKQWAGQSGTNASMACASGAKIVLSDFPLGSGATAKVPLGDITASAAPHILFTLSLPKEAFPGDPFTFAIGFTALGDDYPARQDGLAETGGRVSGFLTAAAALLGAGLYVTLRGRRRNIL
ncbi:hypothetical protein [Pseudarthrobacter sp. NamB4]|uniref:hypothetical protein n=1 Tax=Pseudarthrobacter sp. NamB4 TaxID=2576837 RepID=UPI0010FCEBB9|nr:hypothetical protein [Pseudarthrobacter sp. NamB4]TLM70918.1 hypothetical protein FDW81_16810 [Pseudarthrobacter sp. NamB4]